MNILHLLYKYLIGPSLHIVGGAGFGCRFSPSCSDYACEAFSKHRAFDAFMLSVRRIIRCNPWSKAEFFDAVPSAPLRKQHE